ncbi:MAG: hypothetical protein ACJAWF_000965 [Candidatus Azotimanducaceae bacterium]|jgi:hypothetical protein
MSAITVPKQKLGSDGAVVSTIFTVPAEKNSKVLILKDIIFCRDKC